MTDEKSYLEVLEEAHLERLKYVEEKINDPEIKKQEIAAEKLLHVLVCAGAEWSVDHEDANTTTYNSATLSALGRLVLICVGSMSPDAHNRAELVKTLFNHIIQAGSQNGLLKIERKKAPARSSIYGPDGKPIRRH